MRVCFQEMGLLEKLKFGCNPNPFDQEPTLSFKYILKNCQMITQMFYSTYKKRKLIQETSIQWTIYWNYIILDINCPSTLLDPGIINRLLLQDCTRVNPNGAGGTMCPHFFRWLLLHEKRGLEVRNFLTFPNSL